jgi:hypothetical protein
MTVVKTFIREGREDTRRKEKAASTMKFSGVSSWFFASFADKKVFK